LLALADALVGRLDWWPLPPEGAGSSIIGALPQVKPDIGGRPAQRPWRFADAGTTILRSAGDHEIWCRCDGGPHGYLSIAAHAHADALSLEVRYEGVDILADPGTYCYHGEPDWRSYFRSTIAHNTIEVGGQSQSADGGPFMWTRHANAREIEAADGGSAVTWTAEHDGYRLLQPPALHRRSVRLDRKTRTLSIVDEIEGGSHDVRLAFHLGPELQVELEDFAAILSWPNASTPGAARMELPSELQWSLHRGDTDPILGWYAPGLGRRVPAFTLLGSGRDISGKFLTTILTFPVSDESSVSRQAVSWVTSSGASLRETPDTQAEAR
jgi:hypothetical protein